MNEEKIIEKLEDHEERLKKLEEGETKSSKIQVNENLREGGNLTNEIKFFCKRLRLNEEKLRIAVDFQEKIPKLSVFLKEETRKKVQYKALLILGFLWIKIYKKELNEKSLRDIFKLSRIPLERLDHLYSSTYFRKYFTKQGTLIKFSWAGEKKAENTILEIVKNGKID